MRTGVYTHLRLHHPHVLLPRHPRLHSRLLHQPPYVILSLAQPRSGARRRRPAALQAGGGKGG